jgi:hypothetical protein
MQKVTHLSLQILSITCNNASNNDMMVEEMELHIAAFSRVNQTRCFLHILNLIAKSLLNRFELPDAKGEDLSEENNNAFGTVLELADGIDTEEDDTQREGQHDLDSDEVEDDDLSDWVDGARLTCAEERDLKKKVIPITQVLIKVLNTNTYLIPY